MNKSEFLTHVDKILELPEGTLKGDEKLEDLENWDSVSMVSFIALADEQYGTRLTARQFGNCETVDDLVNLAAGK